MRAEAGAAFDDGGCPGDRSTVLERPYSSYVSARESMRVPCIARRTYPKRSTLRRLPTHHGQRARPHAGGGVTPVRPGRAAALGVDDEPAAHELWLELQPTHREPLGPQLLLGVVVRSRLPHLHLVVDERVVHVVADALDLCEVEAPRAKYTARRDGQRRVSRQLKLTQHGGRLCVAQHRRAIRSRLPAREEGCRAVARDRRLQHGRTKKDCKLLQHEERAHLL